MVCKNYATEFYKFSFIKYCQILKILWLAHSVVNAIINALIRTLTGGYTIM